MTKRIRDLDKAKAIMEPDSQITIVKARFRKPKNITGFIEALVNKNSITTLDLSGSDLSNPENVANLVKALNSNPQIKTLKLNNCGMGIGARLLNGLTHVTNLSLSNNNLRSTYLAFNPVVRRINLSNNPIGNKGIEVTTCNAKLTSVKVSNCNLTNRAMYDVAQLPNLRTLDVSFNDVETNGVTSVLSGCKKLQSLNTTGNSGVRNVSNDDIEGTDGFKKMMEPLFNNQLTNLRLPSSFSAAVQIEIMKRSTNLKTLNGETREQLIPKLEATVSAESAQPKPVINEIKVTDLNNLQRLFLYNEGIDVTLLNANYTGLTDGSAIELSKAIQASECEINFVSARGNKIDLLGTAFLLQTANIKGLDLTANSLQFTHQTETLIMRDEFFQKAFFTDNGIETLNLGNKPSDKFLLKLIESRPSLNVFNDKPCTEWKKEIENRLNPKAVSEAAKIAEWVNQKEGVKQENEKHPPHIKDRSSILFGYNNPVIAQELKRLSREVVSGHHRRISSVA